MVVIDDRAAILHRKVYQGREGLFLFFLIDNILYMWHFEHVVHIYKVDQTNHFNTSLES